MRHYTYHFFTGCLLLLLCVSSTQAQTPFIISGRVTDSANKALPNVTVPLAGVTGGTITNANGSFSISATRWANALELTHAGFEKLTVPLNKTQLTGLSFQLKQHVSLLDDVIIRVDAMDQEPGKRFMKKVIAAKPGNDPNRFSNYSYR
ncbi:carboxypeptidase-like regulatory domain-containing protein [Ferruginibacter paludis]|uniref:carboxypeptidase-like regulatory domain-containing protein n=1 Tax=Ferruginibacter paludis TaxID=1310417 RepID=UPI0025B3F9E4|nr:carboxypeptidase-like regulatory domain-containing protein [Ferruginibacter paludis]MDN3656705.1 carboxypeptidase-like regulatory domain-containing protein [Ferruginibacter paludis]